MTLEQFIKNKIQVSTPGSKGWIDRRRPAWEKEYHTIVWEEYTSSPEYISRQKAAKEKEERLKKEALLKIEIGESRTLRGSFGPLFQDQILSQRWLGSGFYSHSELRHSDCVYIGENDIKVVSFSKGDEYNFDVLKIERIK